MNTINSTDNSLLIPSAHYLSLLAGNASAYLPTNFVNDIGQQIMFYEDPERGDEYPLWVAFPEYKVAFLSDFYETDDMTCKLSDLMSYEEIIKSGWNVKEDCDYVPRLVSGKMLHKFETYEESNVVTTSSTNKKFVIPTDPNFMEPEEAKELLDNVRRDIDRLLALGESYYHFQSAQVTHKYLKKAKNALKGLS